MPRPWLRWVRRIVCAMAAVFAALALLWAILWLCVRLSPPWDGRTVIAIAIVALALLAGIWWLWWRLPRRQVARLALKIRDPKARADTEDNFRKTVGQALGGAAVLIGAGVAYLQFTQQQQASHDVLISNQVSKGFEQLGSKELVVRLGGIYALEGVMNGSEQYHQPVLEALCAFVRDGAQTDVGGAPPTTDIQAALTVIGRRKNGPGRVDLAGANLPKANLIGAGLANANLAGAALSGVTLSGADLTSADLSSAKLNDATLWSANMQSTNLTGAHLNRANLRFAYLRFTNLIDANLTGVDLTSANLFGASLVGAKLQSTNLSGAHLDGANLLRSENLSQMQLDGACGADAMLPPGLTLKPCLAQWEPFRATMLRVITSILHGGTIAPAPAKSP